ncbi:MAG: NifU family protein [Lentisphaerae bacterium]|nr:NifU family protein [Lentisphaerota bacterium]
MKVFDILVEPTAHPRARKFILDRDVRAGDPIRFTTADECKHVPLAAALLSWVGVSDVHFAGNVITVTAGRGADWQMLEARLREEIARHIEAHDPSMRDPNAGTTRATIGDLAVIDGVLEQTIRPYIRSHGGELELLEYDAETKRLLVNYLGTCGSCPASTSGTLEIIQQILKDEFDPEIKVEILQ